MYEVKCLSQSKLDIFYLIVTHMLIVGMIILDYYLCSKSLIIRFLLGIIISCAACFLLSLTTYGKRFFIFFKESKMELRKVVWPPMDETMKTTGIVIVLVFAMSIVLWTLDLLLLWLVSLINK